MSQNLPEGAHFVRGPEVVEVGRHLIRRRLQVGHGDVVEAVEGVRQLRMGWSGRGEDEQQDGCGCGNEFHAGSPELKII